MNIAMDKNGILGFNASTGDFAYVNGHTESLQHVYTVMRAERATICRPANMSEFIGHAISEQMLDRMKKQAEIALNFESPLVQGVYVVAGSIISPTSIELRIYEAYNGIVNPLTSVNVNLADGIIEITESGMEITNFDELGKNGNTLATRIVRRS